jgi:hypothetical protein
VSGPYLTSSTETLPPTGAGSLRKLLDFAVLREHDSHILSDRELADQGYAVVVSARRTFVVAPGLAHCFVCSLINQLL